MVKIIPTHKQIETIEKYGLSFEDVVLGKKDGDIIVKDRWKLGAEERWYLIERSGEFEVRYKNPMEG